jgi:hypothetical protein
MRCRRKRHLQPAFLADSLTISILQTDGCKKTATHYFGHRSVDPENREATTISVDSFEHIIRDDISPAAGGIELQRMGAQPRYQRSGAAAAK